MLISRPLSRIANTLLVVSSFDIHCAVTFTLPMTCHMPAGFTLVSISLPTNCFCESSLFSFTCSHCNKFSTSPLVSKLKIKLPQVHCWSHSHLLQVTFIWLFPLDCPPTALRLYLCLHLERRIQYFAFGPALLFA